jgi:hypothetical protein
MKKLFIPTMFLLILSFHLGNLNAQSEKEIKNFFQDNIPLILSLAHKNSTLISSEIEIIDSDDSEFDYKVVITINYKGFLKNHTLKCFTYFEDYPQKFIWGSDTNSFKYNNEPELVLEELKYSWNKFIKK